MTVTFDKIKINECYQYYNRGDNGANVITKFDPTWGNIANLGLEGDIVSELIAQMVAIQDEIQMRMEIYAGTPEDIQFLNNRISDLRLLRQKISNAEMDEEVKLTLLEQIDALIQYTFCSADPTSTSQARKDALAGVCSLNPWVALAKCLGAASLDIFGSYAFKWVELKLNGTPKAFSDFSGITSQMDWQGVLSSATVSCVFSAIPIPTGKTALVAMVGGAGLAASETFASNVLTQYNSLKNTYSSPTTIVRKINWQQSFIAAGGAGAITFISTALIRASSHSAVLALKNRIIDLAKRKGSDFVRTQLKNLGFTDEIVDRIFLNWGVKGSLARSLLPNTKVAFKKTFNSTDFASGQTLPITIIQKAGKTFAQSAEELIADLFEKKGMKKLESKIGGDNGFDILLVDNISNPKQVIVIEVKSSISSTHSASMNNPVNACVGSSEPQMSWCWIGDVYERMTKSPNMNIKQNAAKIESFIKSGTIERYVVSALNPSGEAKIIRL